MPNLVNKETGQVEFFRTEEVPKALASGKYAPEDPEQKLSFVDVDGTQFTVPIGESVDLAGRIGKEGVREEDPSNVVARVKEQRLQEEFGDGMVNDVTAGLEGVASGLTLGFGDPLIEAIDPNFEERKKRNPTAFTIGEVGSLFLPGVGVVRGVGKGAGMASRVLSRTPAGLAARAGERVATKVGARGGRILGTAAGAATEGALYSGGLGLSNILYSDKPLTGEAVLADLGRGALFGGIVGGVGGAFSSGISRVARRADKADEVSRLQEFLAEAHATTESQAAFEKALAKPLSKIDGVRKAGSNALRGVADPDAARALSASLNRFDDAAKIAARDGTRTSAEALSRAAADLGDNIASVRALDPKTGLLAKGEEAATLRTQIDDAIERINPSSSPKLTRQAIEEVSTQQTKIMQRLDETASQARLISERGLEVSRIAGRTDDAARFERALGDLNEAEKAVRVIDLSPEGIQKMTPKELSNSYSAVARYDDAVRSVVGVADPKLAAGLSRDLAALSPSAGSGISPVDLVAAAEVFDVVDIGEITGTGAAGEALLYAWLLARAGGAASGIAKKSGGSKLVRAAAQRGAASAAFQGGIQSGQRLGLGRGTTGFLGGAFAAAGSAAASGVSKVSSAAGRTFQRIDKALNRITRKPIRSAATMGAIQAMERLDVLGDGKSTVTPRKGETKAQALYKKKTEELARALSNPDAVRMRVRAALTDLQDLDPLLAAEVEEAFMRKVEFLGSRMPRRKTALPLFGEDKWRPSRHEIDTFVRLVNAVEDPVGVLEGLHNNKLTLGAVEAIRSVYPSLYREMQIRLLSDEELVAKMPYRSRVKAAMFFDVSEIEPTMRLTQPTAERFLQLAEQGQGPQTGTTPPPPQRTRDRALTPAQRLQE